MKNKEIILLDRNKIKKNIGKKNITITVFEEIESTNDWLKNNFLNDKSMQVCIAEMQTRGRGRLNKKWHSPFGENIYFSLRTVFEKNISELSGLSMVVALAVCHAIEFITKINTLKIKWPNDILFYDEKISGILIDVNQESATYCSAIIGIGINVNMSSALENEIDQPWNSLQKITGKYFDRNELCSALIVSLDYYLKRFSELGLSDFKTEWKEKDYLFGKSVSIMLLQKKLVGIGNGINSQGHLVLTMLDQTGEKAEKAFSSGEATILK